MSITLHFLRKVKVFHYNTYLHSIRVAMLSNKIGVRIGLNSKELDQLATSALLHDIGKLQIPESILNKPGKLNTEEWIEIKKHPCYALEMLQQNKSQLPKRVIQGVYNHHEFFDGTGYPLGLKNKEINIYARVIAIADALDAMTTKRPYRSHELSMTDAIQEVLKCKGTQFDPYICKKISGLASNTVNR